MSAQQQQQSGWKFSVTIPSWTTTTLESDEPVVVRKKGAAQSMACVCLMLVVHALSKSLSVLPPSPEPLFSCLFLVPSVISDASYKPKIKGQKRIPSKETRVSSQRRRPEVTMPLRLLPHVLSSSSSKKKKKKFYRVEVKVLPPSGEPRVRSVLRRYSHFERLHDRLKEELGPRASAGLELLPPKRSLAGPLREARAVDRRRRELEAWLWRVVAHQGAALSRPVQAFLELGDAARTVGPRTAVGGGENGGSSDAAAAAAAAASAVSEDDGRLGSSASASSLRPPSLSTGPSSEASSSPGGAGKQEQQPRGASSASAPFVPPSQVSRQPPSSETPFARQPPPAAPPPRLALPVDHRAAIRATSRELRARLATAALDMRAAVDALRGAEASKEALADRVAALEAVLADRKRSEEEEAEAERESSSEQRAKAATEQAAFLSSEIEAMRAKLERAELEASEAREGRARAEADAAAAAEAWRARADEEVAAARREATDAAAAATASSSSLSAEAAAENERRLG